MDIKVKGLVSFQPNGTKARKDKRVRKIESEIVRMSKNTKRYCTLMDKAKKAENNGYALHAEKLRDMAKQFI